MDKNTPPLSPEVRDPLSLDDDDDDDDEMMLDENAYEVIEVQEANGESEDLSDNENDKDSFMDSSMEEPSLQSDDAAYVFQGHAHGETFFFIVTIYKHVTQAKWHE